MNKWQSWDSFPGESDSNVNSKYSQGWMDHYLIFWVSFIKKVCFKSAKTNLMGVKNFKNEQNLSSRVLRNQEIGIIWSEKDTWSKENVTLYV